MNRPLYPRAFRTPDGRMVGVRQFSKALAHIRTHDRQTEYPGWNWFPTPGWMILNEARRGMHDRINRR